MQSFACRAVLLAGLVSGAQAGSPAKGRTEIALVLIDEASQKALGWPLSGAALAAGLKKIQAGKPAAVALKFFLEADAEDALLLEALASGKNVYLQCAGTEDGQTPDAELLMGSRIGSDSTTDFDDRPKVLFPPKALARAAAGVGFVHVKLNQSTNAAERWQVVSMAGGQRYASLPLLLVARADRVAPAAFALKSAGEGWMLASAARHWMLDHEGALRIRFNAPGKGYARHSFRDVHAGRVPASSFAGRIVVIGPNLPARADNGIKTPVAPAHSKVELFADALATLLKP